MSSLKVGTLLRKVNRYDPREAKRKEFYRMAKQLKSYKRMLKKEGITQTDKPEREAENEGKAAGQNTSQRNESKQSASAVSNRGNQSSEGDNQAKSPGNDDDAARAPASRSLSAAVRHRSVEHRRQFQKTSRGQPVMRGKLESLVEKLERQRQTLNSKTNKSNHSNINTNRTG